MYVCSKLPGLCPPAEKSVNIYHPSCVWQLWHKHQRSSSGIREDELRRYTLCVWALFLIYAFFSLFSIGTVWMSWHFCVSFYRCPQMEMLHLTVCMTRQDVKLSLCAFSSLGILLTPTPSKVGAAPSPLLLPISQSPCDCPPLVSAPSALARVLKKTAHDFLSFPSFVWSTTFLLGRFPISRWGEMGHFSPSTPNWLSSGVVGGCFCMGDNHSSTAYKFGYATLYLTRNYANICIISLWGFMGCLWPSSWFAIVILIVSPYISH